MAEAIIGLIYLGGGALASGALFRKLSKSGALAQLEQGS